ncbi:unnamed protein product [Medioppia subpectinata]|uniref:P21-activated protein kinase-interacting protein 1-like n=1 Tax=Medioppia subpectinata TaxID=1979941 RepID=A0A7R9LU98_9ACAR|nr:unnamed protein product [Medioppia subpectinata]CAG2121761.1 unnamed protein product [Medioppia subpectinata]
MLSVSTDKTLRTWNLIKGRCAYVTNIKAVAHIVQWSPSSALFAVVIDKRVDIYDIATGGVVHAIDYGKRVNSIVFLNNDVIAIGGDSNDIHLYDIPNKHTIHTFTAHENRVKALQKTTTHADITGDKVWLISVSSDSYIKVWELDLTELKREPKLIASVDTTCRPTCMSVRTFVDSSADENSSQPSAALTATAADVVSDENAKTSSKKRKNKSKEKANKKV